MKVNYENSSFCRKQEFISKGKCAIKREHCVVLRICSRIGRLNDIALFFKTNKKSVLYVCIWLPVSVISIAL